ncbi:MAG: hypothetical protein JNL74_15830 [Fibrobacteres bacterium]|nr:hypothetical protein [Fibrobacterota bacterium]
MLRMDGWCHESTVLIENNSPYERINEFVEVKLTVSNRQVTDPVREVRVIFKTAWNNWEKLIPCQVAGVQPSGETISFRVSFFADVPANGTARYGIVYGNRAAEPQQEKLALYVRDKKERIEIDNPGYVVSVDKKSGQLSQIIYKYFRTGFLIPVELTPATLIQPGVSIQTDDGKWLTAAEAAPYSVETESGAVCYKHAVMRDLKESGIKVSTEMIFPASQPFVNIKEKIFFGKSTSVFNIKTAGHRFPAGIYSHFTFRPVTKPALKKTEVEEMGHLLIDPMYSGNLPNGTMVSGFMPLLMPWTAMSNIHRNKWYTQVRYMLDWNVKNVNGSTVPEYRAATYLFKEDDFYESALMPVYTKNTNDKKNCTVIPAGTEISYEIMVAFSPFEEVVWGKKTDQIGRVLNSPLNVSVYPRFVNAAGEWEDHSVTTFAGKRNCDYQTSGVR